MERVFEPFVRMENSRNRETGGIGLGLSIARDVVRRHGGDIVLTNTGSGLRATITLPPAEMPIESQPTPAPGAHGRDLPAPPSASARR